MFEAGKLKIFVDIQDNRNLGDDLLFLANIKNLIKINWNGHKVQYLVKSYRLRALALEFIEFNKILGVNIDVGVLGNCDVYIHSGGTLFTNRYSFRTRLAFALRKALPSSAFQKTGADFNAFMSLGIDDKVVLKQKVSQKLSEADFVWCRDVFSCGNYHLMVGDLGSLYYASDAVYSLKEFLDILGSDVCKTNNVGIISRGITCFNPRSVTTLDTSVSIGFNGEGGTDLSYDGSFESLKETIRKIIACKLIYTERFHGAILSDLFCIPQIVNGFDQKLRVFCNNRDSIPLGSDLYLISEPLCGRTLKHISDNHHKIYRLIGKKISEKLGLRGKNEESIN